MNKIWLFSVVFQAGFTKNVIFRKSCCECTFNMQKACNGPKTCALLHALWILDPNSKFMNILTIILLFYKAELFFCILFAKFSLRKSTYLMRPLCCFLCVKPIICNLIWWIVKKTCIKYLFYQQKTILKRFC